MKTKQALPPRDLVYLGVRTDFWGNREFMYQDKRTRKTVYVRASDETVTLKNLTRVVLVGGGNPKTDEKICEMMNEKSRQLGRKVRYVAASALPAFMTETLKQEPSHYIVEIRE